MQRLIRKVHFQRLDESAELIGLMIKKMEWGFVSPSALCDLTQPEHQPIVMVSEVSDTLIRVDVMWYDGKPAKSVYEGTAQRSLTRESGNSHQYRVLSAEWVITLFC